MTDGIHRPTSGPEPDDGNGDQVGRNRAASKMAQVTHHLRAAPESARPDPVDDLHCDFRPGTMSAITGPSGCGKTTLLTCLAGVAEFHGGRAWVAGQPRVPGSLAKPGQLRDVGLMFQDYRLVRSLSVRDNVALPLVLDGWTWRSARPLAVDLLQQFGLNDHLRKRPSSLSGGEQQRVALARAAIVRPKVLLADEPSAHLDGESAGLLASFLLGLARWGACVVVSTHDPRLLASCHHEMTLR